MKLILAAGHQRRWHDSGGKGCKQLIDINGELLIKRTQRIFKDCVVVTRSTEIIEHSKSTYTPPSNNPNSWLIVDLLNTQELWKDQVIVLLGDVYYSEHAVRLIKSYTGKCMFFGDTHDIYAVSFHNYDKMLKSLNKVITMHEQHEKLKYNGRLWTLYRNYNGIEILDHKIRGGFTHINDGTCDFDFYSDYERWKSGNQ